MNIARNFHSLKTALGCLNRSSLTSKSIRRESHVVSYRKGPPAHSNATKIGAIAVGGAMWWWVIWHLWHEPDHITGEFEYPNSAKWSNSELGIPKDD
ncbi:uncharacterized protein Dana_GF23100 [Drosophila ananassae]|uniref:NADH dehydrogenase [ubiquinone] 1 beta subcomplex subunit 2, mitochondrial n=1 Tax=Drosophila ananassae TaxID=7217 RepID=B3MTK9_DROAN|nr:NADH dehydrogenase [ubiquinone] 1 beta subcomplex subunit 2, mitochondrial [Drosophila ananassae]EDV30140.1 uncharacterized protein Dana_GF23100 [Drosophila ananassae]